MSSHTGKVCPADRRIKSRELGAIVMQSKTIATNLSSTPAHWMPFTANRQFHKDPRVVVAAEQNHYISQDGRRVLTRYPGFGVRLWP